MIDLATDIWSGPVRSLHTRRLSATTAGAVRTSTFAIWSGDGEVVQLAPASSRLVRLKRPILFHCQKVPTYRSEYRRLRLFWEQTEVDRIRCESMTSSCGAPIRFAKGCYTATRQASKRWARPLNGSIDLEVTPPTEHNNGGGQESPPPTPLVLASSTSNDRFVLQYSDSEDSLDFRGTIVWRQFSPVVSNSTSSSHLGTNHHQSTHIITNSAPPIAPAIFVCPSDDWEMNHSTTTTCAAVM